MSSELSNHFYFYFTHITTMPYLVAIVDSTNVLIVHYTKISTYHILDNSQSEMSHLIGYSAGSMEPLIYSLEQLENVEFMWSN